MNHIKCTVNTFRNRLWPFNRTRSDKKKQFLPGFCCFFGGLIFQITCELYFQGCSVLYPPPKNFSTTKQLPPEESGDSLRFSRRLQRALSPMGLLQGRRLQKSPGLQGGISRTLIAGRRFCFLPPTGICDQIQYFFLGCQAPTPQRMAEPKVRTGFQSLAT